MDKVYISSIDALGYRWAVYANDYAVTGIFLDNTDVTKCENPISKLAAQQVLEYIVNIRNEFDFPLELHGTPFQIQVWHALRSIPYGTAVSYSDIAARIGKPKAVRAVGQAIGKNPCLIAVPCHRVLGKNGSLTGFSAGMELKKKLLKLEGISYFP